ncbi:hypothetical protein ACIGEZ_01255 [Streptomyces sp. NPDC085481]|uniref:hypothetical protein n=1 Tax=Streptomyces sp. NPDC085481 TaxID=3365727 RepID=UPI0037D653B9
MNEFTPEQLRDADDRAAEMASPPQQLKAALQQAEGYRNFLTTLTGLLTVIFVLKGQENLGKLTAGPKWTVIGLLSGAFLLLITASWMMVSAVHERPGRTRPLGAVQILRYERDRARTVRRMTDWARWLGLVAVLAVAAAALVTWIVPGAT